jgi:putative polyketide hydroxylase
MWISRASSMGAYCAGCGEVPAWACLSAGYAAHTMPPWGGQGANSGITDVHNLAWKLAAVLHNKALPNLLTTYDEERLPLGRLIAEESGAAADENGLFAMWKSVPAILALVKRMPRLAGYGYSYRSQAIIEEDETPWLWRQRWLLQPVSWICSLSATAGNRAPHLSVRHNGKEISLLDLFGKSFVLLAGKEGDAWREAAEKIMLDVGVELVAYSVGSNGDLVCGKGKWESVAGISGSGALLVRPDGFIAWRAYGQPVGLKKKLETVLMQALCR